MKLPIFVVALKVTLMVCERLLLMIVLLEIERTPVKNIILVIRKVAIHRYYNFKRIIRKLMGRNTKISNY